MTETVRRGIPEAVQTLDTLTSVMRRTVFRDPTLEEIRHALETTVVIHHGDPVADEAAERAAADADLELFGIGFLVDGRRVSPTKVVVRTDATGGPFAMSPVPR